MITSTQIRENQRIMIERDKAAKANGELKGRYVREPIADGYAYYEITKVTKTKVKIKLVTGIGDDYRVNYWGNEATIERAYAESNIKDRDFWASL